MMLPTPPGYRRSPFGLIPVATDYTTYVTLTDGREAEVTASVLLTAAETIVEDLRVKVEGTGEVVEDFDEKAYPYLHDDLAYKAMRASASEVG